MTAPPRALLNSYVRPDDVLPPPGNEIERFHRKMVGYVTTPLRPLDTLTSGLGVGSVLMKDESDRFGLPSFKALGASWALEQAVRGDPSIHTVVAASAGNHGRAVARCAASRGLACRIYLPSGSSADRARLIAGEGAEVISVNGGYDDAVEVAEHSAQQPGTVLVADVSKTMDAVVPGWVTDGYSTLFREISRQAVDPVEMLLVPVGVGSLAAAAVRWAVHESPGTRVVGVEPAQAACVTESLRVGDRVTVHTPGTTLAGLNCPTPSAVAWPTVRDGLCGTVTVHDHEVHDAMRALSSVGLRIGDCGAATLAALRALVSEPACRMLRDEVGLGDTARVICIGTEGVSDPVAYRAVMGSGSVTASS